jgi:SPP1 family predicted phage head-tail adaptor
MAFLSKLKAGDFNVKLQVKSQSNTSNNVYGEIVVSNSSYQNVKQVWANINVTSLRNMNEKFEGDKLQSYNEFYILIRYDASLYEDMKPDYILVDIESGEIYKILAYTFDPRKEFIEFRTKLDRDGSIA